jgi:hypothetical protein
VSEKFIEGPFVHRNLPINCFDAQNRLPVRRIPLFGALWVAPFLAEWVGNQPTQSRSNSHTQYLKKASVPHPCDFFLSHGWDTTNLILAELKRGDRARHHRE